MSEYSKSRPYLIAASVLDFLCTAAYLAVAIGFIISGLALMTSAGKYPDGATSEEVASAAIAAPFVAIAGILIIVIGAICFIAVAIALASAITGVVKVNKPILELKKSTKLIKASYILNFSATGFFAMAALGSVAKIGGEDFASGGNAGKIIAGVAAILVIAGIRCACGVLKIKAVKIISEENECQVQPQPATFFGGEENSGT